VGGLVEMKLLILQLLTSLTATCLITFTVTHMHMEQFYVQWFLWSWHWIVAWPIAFVTIRWIAPQYKKLIDKAF
jgi:hypothetical protein